jgi:pimeloyl-ACP methyl ester carboxylesterase
MSSIDSRIRPAEIFDRTGAIRRPPLRGVLREVVFDLTYFPPWPPRGDLPDGRGHVVLVVPAFLTNDLVTRRLRKFLQQCGYRGFGWGLGVNWGPTPRLAAALRRRLAELRSLADDRVSVVGLSLGGVLVRDLAYDCPNDIRQVITIASPFNLPTAAAIEPLIRLTACFYRPALDVARLATPLPVPSTAIFTRDDGIVAPESCRRDEPGCESVEVRGPHLTICRNPDVLRAVAMRLGQATA